MPDRRNKLVASIAKTFGAGPVFRRLAWHARRMTGQLDRRFFINLITGALGIVIIAATLVTFLEKPWTEGLQPALQSFGNSLNWAFFTVLGQGDSSYVSSVGGILVSWLLVLFGVAIVGTITGALVALVIDLLLKEGQGMGASGYRDHIVVCGWNTTARDLIEELRSDEYPAKVVLIADLEKNPAPGAYFVRGDTTTTEDLKRGGIEEASAALVFPTSATNDADMHSILTLMAIHAVAPNVRTVAEVNNPRHVEHFQRANVDELLVTSRLASRLLARSALYPGLSGLVTDIVSGGEGSELYRIDLPDDLCGLTVDEVSARLRSDHRATLLAVSRHGQTYTNPASDFKLQPGDDALVVAESLKTLTPLHADRAVPITSR